MTPWASRAAFASSVARPYAELILWRPRPSARATKESRGIEIATARAFGAGRDVQQDDRVGVQLAFVVARPQFRQQPRRQGVARGVRAAVQPHEERRERLLGLRRHGPAADDVARDDAVGQRPVDRPAVPGADQQRERQHRGDRAPDRAGDHGAAGGRLRLIRTDRRPRAARGVGATRAPPSDRRRAGAATPPGHGTAAPDVAGTLVTPS